MSRLLPLAFLILPPLLLYWPFLFGGKTLYWGTALLQFWPWRRFAVQELLAGRLPLWNPYAGSGVPLLADHQSAIFYPLNVLYLFLPVERAMGVSLAVHAVLAAWTMYALLREWGVSRLGGAVGGLAFSLSGYMVARGSFLTEISALPWLPLLWLYAERILGRKKTAKSVPMNVVSLALVIAVQFLAGHAQTWFYSLCSLALVALWETLRRLRRTWRLSPNSRFPVRSMAGSLLPNCLLFSAVLWGIALSAAQFLPTLELSLLARRAHDAGWETYALQYSMWPWRLVTLLLPDFFGNPARGNYWGYATYWEDAGYVGVLPFVLAVWAVIAWAGRRRASAKNEVKCSPTQAPAPDKLRHAPLMAALVLIALLMALGKNTPFYLFFFRYVPGLSAFQAPARWLGVYTAAIAALAGLGADALRTWRLGVFCRLGVAGGISAGLVALLGRATVPGAMDTFADAVIRFAALWIGAMLLLLWDHPWRSWRLGHSIIVLFAAADLIWAGYGLNPAGDPALYEPQTGIGTALATDGPQGRTFASAKTQDEVLYGRYLDFGDYGPAADTPTSVEHWWGLRETLLPDLGMVERLPSANTFEPLIEARTRTLLAAVNEMPREIARRTLGAMNVAYLLDASPAAKDDVVHRSPTMVASRNPHLMPRAYVVHHVRRADSPEQALSLLFTPDFDPTQEAILEKVGSKEYGVGSKEYRVGSKEYEVGSKAHETRNSPSATLLPSPPNRVTIRAVLPQPGILVLSDTAYPGWQATVDGRAVEVYRANYVYRAVILEAGAHKVVFWYRPLSLLVGALISATAGVGALAVVLSSWKKRVAGNADQSRVDQSRAD